MTVSRLWQSTLDLLQKNLYGPNTDSWLTNARPVAFYDNVLVVGTPNEFTREIISTKYGPFLQRALFQLTGKEIDLKLVVDESPDTIRIPGTKEVQPPLNPRYDFDNFVVGNSNRFAHAAAQAVAQMPSKAYNPLFLYGGVGLGKTHLMHAIGNLIQRNQTILRVCYITAENFTNDMINSIQNRRMENFRATYRTIDILLIDDIQFISGKEQTQEEFFHTFETLHGSGKQVVISSDNLPKDIPTLEERLRSRFEWGLISDIQPPDLETRVAILRKKVQPELSDEIPQEVLFYIATHMETNIRELEGALTRVLATASMNNRPIDLELTEATLREIMTKEKRLFITPEIIQKAVAAFYGVRPEELRQKRREQKVVLPRQVAMYITRELCELSLPLIGQAFSRDHSTVHHSIEKIKNIIENDLNLKNIVHQLIISLQKGEKL